jgi:type VI protein secretion system component VasF
MRNQRRISPTNAQYCGRFWSAVSHLLVARDHAISGAFDRDRRIRQPGKEGIMRRITAWHRTLVVLAIGLLALAAPLVALADNGGPHL